MMPIASTKREQRDRVYREVEIEHDRQGADARRQQADHYPERKPYLQEQGERRHHQQESQKAVLEQEVQPLGVTLGVVVPDRDPHAIGQRRKDHVRDVIVHGPGDIHHLLSVRPRHLDEYCGVALMPHDQVRVLETVAYIGDIAQPHRRAVFPGYQDDVLEVLLVVPLADGADTHLGVPGVDAACGKIERCASHSLGDILQCQSKRTQALERNLDGNLVASCSRRLDVRDAGKRCQFLLDLVSQFLQRARGYVAVHDQADHALAIAHLAELWPLRGAGEGLGSGQPQP